MKKLTFFLVLATIASCTIQSSDKSCRRAKVKFLDSPHVSQIRWIDTMYQVGDTLLLIKPCVVQEIGGKLW